MLTVKCPTCRRRVDWNETSVYRPFCSDRCRLIDLGAWFKEEHAIPGEPAIDPDDPSSPSDPQDHA